MLPNAIPLHAQKSSCCPPPAAHRLTSSYCTASAKNIRERSKRDAKRGLYFPMLPVLAKLRGPDKLRSTSPHPNEVSPPHPLPGPIAPPCATAAAAVTLSTAAGPRRSSGVPQSWEPSRAHFAATLPRSALRNIHGARTALPPGVAGATLQRVPARPPSTHTRHTNVLLPSTPTPTPHRRSFSIAALPLLPLLPPPHPLPAQLYFIRLGLN